MPLLSFKTIYLWGFERFDIFIFLFQLLLVRIDLRDNFSISSKHNINISFIKTQKVKRNFAQRKLSFILIYSQFIVMKWCIVNDKQVARLNTNIAKNNPPPLMIHIVWPSILLHIYSIIFSPERLWWMWKWSNRCTCNYFTGIHIIHKLGVI